MGDPQSKYEAFACAPGLKLDAHERLSALQFDALANRLDRLEMMLERQERRLWVAVYGVVAVVLAQAFQSIAQAVP
ncbi:hypothetical protein [Aestuariicoccus sp. MJ-SS9]|uniref:GTA head formation protein, RCAP_rcc01685 family n=1 Tax=Aestuariicoccus sp. MJ-SS9 TaxID=3079855 RepID=UPI002911B5EB|nr:hypothetical protein [Aestuariicoccus sp. MJ-SS9]MDU8911074.1 hypothetical protein [Aestuariicoccus sp. MJ-SS9]